MNRLLLTTLLCCLLQTSLACGSDPAVEASLQDTELTDTSPDAFDDAPQDTSPSPDVPRPEIDTEDIDSTSPDDEEEDDDDEVYTLAVISDLNGSYGSTTYGQPVHNAVNWIIDQINPHLVVSTGDMVAGQQAGHDYRAMWQAFHNAVTQPMTAANIPLAVTPGNHDASGYSAFANERAIFVDEWQQHRPALNFLDDTNYPLHYAFEMGPALFISLDATRVGPLDFNQRQWVANILDTYQDYPVKFIYGHIPLFPVAQGRESEILKDFELEQLLHDYNVQMMISGHHHAYYPGQRGALRLMHTACLGSGPRRLITQSQPSDRAVILIHYDSTGILASEAYSGTNFQHVIPRTDLPESLNAGNLLIYRDDL